MDQVEWLACDDPDAMLEFLRGRPSDRKLRLFAAACCRRIWPWMTDERSRRVVEGVERFADGSESYEGLVAAHRAALEAYEEDRGPVRRAAHSIAFVGMDGAARVASAAAEGFAKASVGTASYSTAGYAAVTRSLESEKRVQCGLLRDICGPLPFRSITSDPAWRTPAVPALAQAAYDNRILPAGTLDPDHLAVLADALEESVCADSDILGHLRGSGPHVRGCHVLDALLGKK